MLNERVVLLGSAFGKGLEPVGVVCHTVLVGPLLDALGHGVGDVAVESCAIVDYVYQFLINIGWQILVHLLSVEYLLAEELTGSLTGSCHFSWLSLGSL